MIFESKLFKISLFSYLLNLVYPDDDEHDLLAEIYSKIQTNTYSRKKNQFIFLISPIESNMRTQNKSPRTFCSNCEIKPTKNSNQPVIPS